MWIYHISEWTSLTFLLRSKQTWIRDNFQTFFLQKWCSQAPLGWNYQQSVITRISLTWLEMQCTSLQMIFKLGTILISMRSWWHLPCKKLEYSINQTCSSFLGYSTIMAYKLTCLKLKSTIELINSQRLEVPLSMIWYWVEYQPLQPLDIVWMTKRRFELRSATMESLT